MKINGYLLKSTTVTALGGLLFGFDTAVIAGTTHSLAEVYRLSPRLLGHTVSSALWGTMLGAMLASVPGDRFGRRDSLRIMALLYVASALGCAFAWNWYALIFSRVIGGLAIGGSSVLGPMYITEIAPDEILEPSSEVKLIQGTLMRRCSLATLAIVSSREEICARPVSA